MGCGTTVAAAEIGHTEIEVPGMTPETTDTSRKMIFIAWAPFNRRSETLSAKMGAEYHSIHVMKYKKVYNVPLKYFYQTWKTAAVCFRERPDIVFMQNPPIILPLTVYVCSWFLGLKFVIDSHSAAFMSWHWRWSLPIHKYLSRRAIATIVTNRHFESIVSGWGARPFILRDIPVNFPEVEKFGVNGRTNIVFICTYSEDEPVERVLEAASDHPDVHFYITGNLSNSPRNVKERGIENVTFTDFLSDSEYIGLIKACDGVLVLTDREHTLLRGACEAVSLGKPLVISDTELLREYFPRGAVHVENSRTGIGGGIRRLIEEKNRLEMEVQQLREERWNEWDTKFGELKQLVS